MYFNNLWHKFEEIDSDGNGELDANELSTLFESLGAPISTGTLTNMVRLADNDGNGVISFEEFANIVGACHLEPDMQ